MKYLMAVIDALVGFVQQNPLTVLVILILALGAPALLKGIALFILYFIMGFVLLLVAGVLLFRWRIYRMRKEMEERFGEGFGDAAGGFDPRGFGARQRPPKQEREGEVKVYRTADAPEKRVSEKVGDYVDFEETRE